MYNSTGDIGPKGNPGVKGITGMHIMYVCMYVCTYPCNICTHIIARNNLKGSIGIDFRYKK